MKTLRKSDVRQINERFAPWGVAFTKQDTVQINEDTTPYLLLVNETPCFFYYKGDWVPTLKYLASNVFLKTITVDMGTIPYLAKGADVMRPGITAITEAIQKNEYILVVDERHGKGIAVGKTLYDAATMLALTTGKVIKTIHFVGDGIWGVC